MKIIICCYFILSFLYGIDTVKKMKEQEDYFMSIDIGDLEFHSPKPIIDEFNWILLPSWIIILGNKLIVKVIHKIKGY